jgi:cobalt-precorrin 5A hydrolase/precorrin-3B C17-methyltransferase
MGVPAPVSRLSGALMIGLIAVTGSGRTAAARLAAAWPGQTRSYDGPTRQALTHAWAQCDGLVCFLAVGATVRLIAPLLDSKWTDPAVVCVDESGRHAVAVVGGHAAGANALAARVAEVFSASAVITTATDAVSLPGLDMLGWPTEGAIGTVSRALLDGDLVRLESERTWPLPPLPGCVGDVGDCRILITDRVTAPGPRTAVLRPPSLIIGIDAAREVTALEVLNLAERALAEAGLSVACVATLATADAGTAAVEPGIREAARQRGWRLATYPASPPAAAMPQGRPAVEERDRRAETSEALEITAMSAVEAAAMAGASELVLAQRTSENASVAVARVLPRGRLALIGTGPGARDLLTLRAIRELRRASVVAGLGQSVDHVSDLLRVGTRILANRAGEELACVREAVLQAQLGHAVAIAFPGGADVRALADLVADLAGDDIDVVHVPGITADPGLADVPGSPAKD